MLILLILVKHLELLEHVSVFEVVIFKDYMDKESTGSAS